MTRSPGAQVGDAAPTSVTTPAPSTPIGPAVARVHAEDVEDVAEVEAGRADGEPDLAGHERRGGVGVRDQREVLEGAPGRDVEVPVVGGRWHQRVAITGPSHAGRRRRAPAPGEGVLAALQRGAERRRIHDGEIVDVDQGDSPVGMLGLRRLLRHAAVLGSFGETALDLHGPIGARIREGSPGQQPALEHHLLVLRGGPRAVEDLQIDDAARRDPAAEEHRPDPAATSSWCSRARTLWSARCVATVVVAPGTAHHLGIVEVETFAATEPLEVPCSPMHANDLPQCLGEGLGRRGGAEQLPCLGDEIVVEQKGSLPNRHGEGRS